MPKSKGRVNSLLFLPFFVIGEEEMNNKATIFAQHRHHLTKFDVFVVTITLILIPIVNSFGLSQSSVTPNPSPKTPIEMNP